MLYELSPLPRAAGYGEAVLSLDDAKAHLRVEHDDEDALVGALRDAAINFVEQYCSKRLLMTAGIEWRAEGLPSRACDGVELGVGPVLAVTGIEWRESAGELVSGDASDFRVGLRDRIVPVVGGQWPVGIGGAVKVTFTAGYEEGKTPEALISAVKLMLGHLYMNREAVVSQGATGEVPLGVRTLCAPFRPVGL